jgi:hypothetical protein
VTISAALSHNRGLGALITGLSGGGELGARDTRPKAALAFRQGSRTLGPTKEGTMGPFAVAAATSAALDS